VDNRVGGQLTQDGEGRIELVDNARALHTTDRTFVLEDGDGRVDDVKDRAAHLAHARLGRRGLVGAIDRDVDTAGGEPALGLVGKGQYAGDGWLEGRCVGDAAEADQVGVDVARAVITFLLVR
jgi:hypothetical protein